MNAPVKLDLPLDVWSMPLDEIDVSDPQLYQDEAWHPYFERLRQQAPVHYCADSRYGPFWSVSRYRDIVQCEVNHAVFSNAVNGNQVEDQSLDLPRPAFIRMDPPKHDEQRKVVAPIVVPANLHNMECLIRERTQQLLDALPRGEEFDWVEEVSIKLTTMMLATLFDFPFEDRALLTYWSDVAICNLKAHDAPVHSEAERFAELTKMADYMSRLFEERRKLPPKFDLLSMLAHGEATREMSLPEFIGNLGLLIVGGNDTTRNSMTGGLLALSRFPDEYRKLHANPALIGSLVPEIVRYVTPVIHMRRTTLQATEIDGQPIPAGAKVVLWYVSANRDPDAVAQPNRLIIDRKRPRQHASFGFGIHRCVGNRLAELQLRILWEEILLRFPMIEVIGGAQRIYSNFIQGFKSMPVRIPA
jgi:cytochrome P450